MADELRLRPATSNSHQSIGPGTGTVSLPDSASFALIQAVGGDVRFTISGTTASSSVGFVASAGSPPQTVAIMPTVTIKYYIPSGATLEVQPVQTVRGG